MASTLADRPALPRRLRSRHKQQRGIILLMVVSLLALFLLMGVTFAILAIQYKVAADTQAGTLRYGDPTVVETDMVLDTLISDTNQANSFYGQGLLRDLYGNDYVMCPADSASLPTGAPPDYYPQFTNGNVTYAHEATGGNQFLRITFQGNQTYSPTTPGGNISPIPAYYNGRVLTVYVESVRQWISTRIAHYIPSNTLYVEQLVGPTGNVLLPSNNAPFLINGLPFNGTGAGFNATSNALDALDNPGTNGQVALLPNLGNYQDGAGRFRAALGGLDESWDAADYQNMYLAFVPTDASNQMAPLIPSFHRPELLNFWGSNGGSLGGTPDPTTDTGRAILRQILFRPMPWDHPNFTGGNSNFSGTNYTQMLQLLAQTNGWQRVWDVDNDGDGVPDSIWIDPGLPVLTAANGRRYKRLAAILVKDLDGRVNVNVAGNLAIVADNNAKALMRVPPNASLSPPLLYAGVAHNAPPTPDPALPQLHPNYLVRGLGYGPAEIDFSHIFIDPGSPTNPTSRGYLSAAAASNYQRVLQRRYGNDNQPGAAGEELFSASKALGMVHSHLGSTTPNSNYMIPPDVWGRGTVTMDYFGRPAWLNMGTVISGYGETNDDPYEMQFDPNTAINDTPYTISDLERLLRYPDPDSSMLSTRLLEAAGGNAANYPLGGSLATSTPGVIGSDHRARESLTTLSSHIPVPRTFWRNDGRFTTGGHPGASVLDLYYQRMSTSGNIATTWRQIVPWDFQHGQMFNINRLFGNGQDDGGLPGIIDDQLEPPSGEGLGGMLQLEHLNDSTGLSFTDPRQLYARHLYCLMMLLRPTGYNTTLDMDGDGITGAADPDDTPRFFAQYAINIVDFRDNDSINSFFEYDLDPFNGWSADGDVTNVDPGCAVVWGVERPELLITETVAWHDRRTEDNMTSTEDGKGTTTDTGMMMDDDFDQRLRPKGKLFFELYNPWFDRSSASGAYEKLAPELYNGTQGVQLNATANGSPVWRVKIIKGDTHTRGTDPDQGTPDSVPGADVDRVVYFTDVSALGGRPGESASNRYYPSDPIAPIMPGRYAVVGSSGLATAGPTYTNYVGRSTAGANDANFTLDQGNTRRIILRPNASANVNGFEIQSNSATQMDLNTLTPVVGIAINTGGNGQPKSLNITEPLAGYTATGWTTATPTPDEPDSGQYNPAHGDPLDKNRTDGWGDRLLSNRTYTNERTLCLQRLANPRLPWHAQANPYITIDTSSVDVTAFNGLDARTDPDNRGNTATDIAFSSFERGGSRHFTAPPAMASRLFWRNQPVHTTIIAGSPGDTTHVFAKELVSTLGYLNQGYGQPYTNATIPATMYVGAPQVGAPTNAAFPWLVFNNRPFMSPAELLHVPVTSQSQLLIQFNIINGAPPTNVYDNSADRDQVFSHLPNFTRTNNAVGTVAATDGPMFARLLDYVETPSRFVGTERFYNPQQFNSTAAGGNNPASGYRPPFNFLSRFRDPGRINLNTFADEMIWTALVGDYMPGNNPPPALTGWSRVGDISLARQGYGGTPGQINSGYPSIFSNPFRATEAADLMPNAGVDLRKREAHAGLLRPRVASNEPLLAASLTNAQAFVDPVRSPFFRYLPLQKVANNVTTNSNCFGVWITIGYFEAEDPAPGTINPAQDSRRYPDGLMLGQELGLDAGNTQRHRAFYLIDRSIPVGFMPGVKLNSENIVLLKRQIE